MRGRFSLTAALAGLLLATPAQAAFELRASVDRNVINFGQRIELLVESAGDTLPSGTPDLRALERDFNVLSQNLSTRQTYQNGVRQAQRSWRYTLEPKRSGALRIPALQVDGKAAAPLSVTVRNPAAARPAPAAQRTPAPAQPKPPPEVFMEGGVDRDTVPVQSQLIHTVRVFTAINISGRVTEPSFDRSVPVRKLEERNYHVMRQGRRYTVYEWKYAIFPQKSGSLRIPPATLRARRADNRRNIQVRNKPLQVKVLPIPAGLPGGVWLPAEEFTLREEWNEAIESGLEVGQPVTRKIRMEAKYLLGEQLPAPALAEIPEMKIYPEKPRFRTRKTKRGMIGSREETMVLIPARPGKIELPEIRIPWWDMKKQKLQTAVIPARSLEIIPAQGAAPALGGDGMSSIITAAGEVDRFLAEETPETDADQAPFLPPLPWLALLLALIGLWALFAALWWRERRAHIQSARKRQDAQLQALHSERLALERAETACRRQDPQRLREALLAWGRKRWSDDPPHTLRELCQRADAPALSRALDEMDRDLYRKESRGWESEKLLEALSALRRTPAPVRRRFSGLFAWRNAALPPLYRTS